MNTDVTEPEGEQQAASWPRPGRLRWVALGSSLLVLAAAGIGWTLFHKLDGNIRTDAHTANELRRHDRERPTPVVHEAENILILGSDDRGGENDKYGRDSGTERSDTAILLHLDADRSSATGVSVPRDLMVDIPRCTRPDGSSTKEQFAQFNWAFEFGGTACTIRTVEKLTDIRIDHHVVVDFTGFTELVNAVGGVEVCLTEAVDDPAAHLTLPAGRQTLNGEEALGYVRTRKGIGDGSDTQRIARQQEFLGSLTQKMRDNGILLNPAKLYPVLDAATSSLVADSGLDSLTELYQLARSLRDIPDERIQFLTVPRQPYTYNYNRDELVQPDARELFTALRNDRPVTVDTPQDADGKDANDKDPHVTASASPAHPSPSPGGSGTADTICGGNG